MRRSWAIPTTITDLQYDPAVDGYVPQRVECRRAPGGSAPIPSAPLRQNPWRPTVPPWQSGPPPHLAHHFETPKQQFDAGKLGMWIFLLTEVLFFGGLFCAYAVYRANHPEIFVYAHQFLDKTLGATNTVVLICSAA